MEAWWLEKRKILLQKSRRVSVMLSMYSVIVSLLGTLADYVICQLSQEDEPYRGLWDENKTLVVVRHASGRQYAQRRRWRSCSRSRVRMHLLQHMVDVGRVGLLPPPTSFFTIAPLCDFSAFFAPFADGFDGIFGVDVLVLSLRPLTMKDFDHDKGAVKTNLAVLVWIVHVR